MLDRDAIEKLRLLLAGGGWRDVMKPILETRKKTVQDLAFLLPSERPEPYSKMDDQTATSILRGEAKALEWVLHAFQNQVVVDDINRQRDELVRANGPRAETQPANPA